MRIFLHISIIQKLTLPHFQIFKTQFIVNSICKHANIAASIKRCPQRLKPLLPCCIPNLQQNSHQINHFFVSLYQITCRVYVSPSTSISLFKNSTPIVWKECSSNWFETNLFIRQLFPTPPSPSITILRSVFLLTGLIFTLLDIVTSFSRHITQSHTAELIAGYSHIKIPKLEIFPTAT